MSTNQHKSTITSCNYSELEITHAHQFLPFQSIPLEEWIRYLGFQLNPNDYLMEDWMGLVEKIEN